MQGPGHSGLLARALITRPISTQGFRQDSNICADNSYMEEFYKRLKYLAEESLVYQVEGQNVTLSFTPEAKSHLTYFNSIIEGEMRPFGALAEVKDAASKILNNTMRIAALLHTFCYGIQNTSIEGATTLIACNIATYYLDQFIQIFSEKTLLQIGIENAKLLVLWLQKQGYLYAQRVVGISTVKQYGPNPLRDSANLQSAIDLLVARQFIRYYPHAKPKAFQIINPYLNVNLLN